MIKRLEIEFKAQPFELRFAKQHSFSCKEALAIEAEIAKLLHKGIIVKSGHETDKFILFTFKKGQFSTNAFDI